MTHPIEFCGKTFHYCLSKDCSVDDYMHIFFTIGHMDALYIYNIDNYFFVDGNSLHIHLEGKRWQYRLTYRLSAFLKNIEDDIKVELL